METLVCQNSQCASSWERVPARGRKPLFCPTCIEGKSSRSQPPIEEFCDKIICGDSAKLIKKLPDASIDLVICSPPYFNQRTYTELEEEIGREDIIEDYLKNLLAIFKECVRVTKLDGSIVFNLGDKHIDNSLALIPWRFAILAQDKINVKLVNEVTWVKPNPTPKPNPRRMVPATEPFFHFVRTDKYRYFSDRLKIKKTNTSQNVNIGKGYFSQIEKSDLTTEQKKMAKQELQEAIDEVRSGKLYALRMKIRGIHTLGYGGQQGGRKTQLETKGFYVIKVPGNTMLKDYIEMPVGNIKGVDHPAIYPIELVETFIELTTNEGDIVLDPFMGSGTTAEAAKSMKRKYIGFDLSEKFVKNANERLDLVCEPLILV